MLDERKAAILQAVVKEYISTAQPVGSSRVAVAPGVGVSAATVRNEMAVLEREGYLIQPHVSAGRIPTDKGYRHFVNQLVGPGSLSFAQRQLVCDFFARAHGELEQMLHDTSKLLADLTQCAGVVVGPPHETATIRSAQLVGLSLRTALLVVVLSNGAVEQRLLELSQDTGDDRVAAAGVHLAAHLGGYTLATLSPPPATGDLVTDALVGVAYKALVAEGDVLSEHVYVGGAAQVASAFGAVGIVRQVLATLEEQYLLVSLLRQLLDRGLNVAIGTELGLVPLAECSIVMATYPVEGDSLGSIAVLGPTRMNYPQALAAVTTVSQRLGRRLAEG